MSGEDWLEELRFKTTAEVVAFCKWFLRLPDTLIPHGVDEDENQEKEFYSERESLLKAQVTYLKSLNIDSPQTCKLENQEYFKIVPKEAKHPLSSDGAHKKSSRFNYKNAELFKNRVIYFGEDKETCCVEKFHMDIQKSNFDKLLGRTPEEAALELPKPDYELKKYILPKIDKIVVLTSESTFKALGITSNVTKDEWFPLNDRWAIPTAGQIMAAVLRRNGYNGIMYTSVRNQYKHNLVIFEENYGPLGFKLESSQPLLEY